jgi:aspartyl-tRNA(Asn)/glutamyl-tRNA(Gln) amidotransferase subunit C
MERDYLERSTMLSREQVEHVARLAHLRLSEEEIVRMQEQLGAILESMEMLRQVDTSAIPPTAQVLPLENVTHPDEPAPSIPVEEALANAPDQEAGLFRVPPVLE